MAMAMAATSSSPASNYHVFLSFRGIDTRYGFTGNLYKALTDKGIHTFIDDENLQRGEEITPGLVKAIHESMIAIIVLSQNYASSSFCLDELSTIIHSFQSKGLLVLPVFYKVDPSDVRHQRRSYEEALTKLERRFPDKLQKWKEALRKVADLSGYHFKEGDGYEYKFIESIVVFVSKKVRTHLYVAGHPVGLESRVAQVMELLDVESDDGVHMIGILGMGGIGKSTLARAVYNNLIAHNFDGFCYLEDVREKSNQHGLQYLQSILLQEILKDKSINVTSWRQGASMIAQRLQRKKVLLLVDDVDNLKQLEAIVGSPRWFGLGSRVIITTRYKQLLESCEIKRRYEVHELNKEDSLRLLTWKAFKKEKADPTYEEVLNRALTYASGLPLALEVIGSNLFGKSIETWESTINQYKRIPHTQIQDILKLSFDALQDEEKSVFLDIACCFNGHKLKEVEAILSALYDDSMKHHIGVLVDKSLIKDKSHKWEDTVKMHDLIQDMGRQIEHKESHNKPRKHKRLWLWKDIIEVLEHNKGTIKAEIIYLDVPTSDREAIIEWDGNGFNDMKNLKILIIKNAKFSQGPKYLPNSLRVLEWWGYPSNCLPYDFQPHKFVMCKLPHGCITSFELDGSSKMFQNLTVLNFDYCKSLTKIPDMSDFSNLEKLSFAHCDNLVTVHNSIGHLRKVKEISAGGCRNLVSFPPIHLTSLEELDLSETGLESFPEISGKMENLRRVQLIDTSIKELPNSFVNLVGLQFLQLSTSVVKLPSSILTMPELEEFVAYDCKEMLWVKEEETKETMDSIVVSKREVSIEDCNLGDDFFSIDFFSIGFTRLAQVEELRLSGNNFTFLPECIKEFQALWNLDVSDCKHLQEIRGVPPNLGILNVSNCTHLQEIRGVPPTIRYFYATNCKSLTARMFTNEELYEAEIDGCTLPGAWIPEWFDHHQSGEPSISFWFRNKFPTKILYLLTAPVVYLQHYPPFPMVFINGEKYMEALHPREPERTEMDHTFIFNKYMQPFQWSSKVVLEKEWNHLELILEGVIETSDIKAMGIHAFKRRESSEEDIRFSNPCWKRKLYYYLNSFQSDNSLLPKRRRLQ